MLYFYNNCDKTYAAVKHPVRATKRDKLSLGVRRQVLDSVYTPVFRPGRAVKRNVVAHCCAGSISFYQEYVPNRLL